MKPCCKGYRLLAWAAVLVLLATSFLTFSPTQAQSTAPRYFPETGHFLQGSFRTFWDANGGVAIFGYPITEEYVGPDGRIVQWFERARFELVERDGRAVVELGLIGVEYTGGREFPKVPPIENTADRRYIPETQHIIQYGFKTIWEQNGAERIFGYPISEEIDERFPTGRWHTVQYFERARFEYWPEFPPGQRVLITALGRALAPPERTAPVPPDQVPSSPQNPAPPQDESPAEPQAPAIPQSVNAAVAPLIGPPGTTFVFNAQGFVPGERVGIWLTAPNGEVSGAGFQATADLGGTIANEGVAVETGDNFVDGVWSFNAQGVDSGSTAVGYFLVQRGSVVTEATPAPAPAPPTPDPAPEEPAPQPTPVPQPTGAASCANRPDPNAATNFPIQIVGVDKVAEVVTLRNLSEQAVSLDGWLMCSLNGSQTHSGIGGSIGGGETRDFGYTGAGSIWNNEEPDDGALYDSTGRLVSYWND